MIVVFPNILRQGAIIGIKIISKNCSTNKSALLVSGRIKSSVTPPVEPCLNIEHILKNKCSEMKASLALRNKGNVINISLDEIIRAAERLRSIEEEERLLNCRRDEIKALFKESEDPLTIDNIKEEAKKIKSSLKTLKYERWNIEETALIDYLRLPNFLDQSTPQEVEDQIIAEFGTKPVVQPKAIVKSHSELCHNDIEFSDNSPTCYYLLGDLAKLEMKLSWASQNFLLDAELDMCSGPDFTRSAVIEGCDPSTNLFGETAANDKVFSLAATSDFGDISSLAATHLVGSASLESLISYYVKNVITNPALALPKSYFCCGRKYSPIDQKITKAVDSLYNAQQSTAIELICVTEDPSSLNDKFLYIESVIKLFYSKMGLHCRIVKRNAVNINDSAASLKLTILIYSPFLKDFVEVGHLSSYNDFLSKRLMLLSENSDCLANLHIIGGTFMNVTKMIGCVIENAQIVGSTVDHRNVKENLDEFISALTELLYTKELDSIG